MRFLRASLLGEPPPAIEDFEWPWAVRAGVAILSGLLAVGVAAQHGELFPPGWSAFLAAVAAAPAILFSFEIRIPRLLFPAMVLGASAALLVDTVEPGEPDITPFFLVLLATQIGCLGTLRESAAVTAAALAVLTGSFFGLAPGHLPWYLGIIFGWLGGVLFQHEVRLLTQLRAAQADLAERSAAEERQRIARELHDVIAHSLTVTMLHLTGARRALERDPAEGAEALEEAERLGRQSLADVRRAVGLLGPNNERRPMPGASDIAGLVDELAATDMDVRLDIEGDLAALPPATGLALYRIVQESLTNVAKHARGTPVTAKIIVRENAVTLKVCNPLAGREPLTARANDGLGLWGMKERASLLGGKLEAGHSNGEWMVEATLPLARQDA